MEEYATTFRDRYGSALLADAAFRAGVKSAIGPPGLTPLTPAAKVAGPVMTVRAANDLVAILVALHRARAGEVLFITNRSAGVALIGDLIALEAQRKQLAGIVVDGLVRDSAELESIGLPVFSHGVLPIGPLKLPPHLKGIGQVAVPVTIGEATVEPGDWIFGDRDGLVFLAAADIAAVFDWAERSLMREEALAAEIRAGKALGELLQIEAFLAKREADESADFNEHLLAAGRAI